MPPLAPAKSLDTVLSSIILKYLICVQVLDGAKDAFNVEAPVAAPEAAPPADQSNLDAFLKPSKRPSAAVNAGNGASVTATRVREESVQPQAQRLGRRAKFDDNEDDEDEVITLDANVPKRHKGS